MSSKRDLDLETVEYYWGYLTWEQKKLILVAVLVYSWMLTFVKSSKFVPWFAVIYSVVAVTTVLVVLQENAGLSLAFGILLGGLTVLGLFYLVFKYLL